MIRGIDHLVIACDDPDAAAGELAATLGIACTGGGRHEAFGTRNRLAFLADGSYLELIGVSDPDLARRSPVGAAALQALETNGGGLATWAVLVDDAATAVAELNAAGASYGPPIHGTRRRDDEELVEWWTAVPDTPLSPVAPFLIQHADTGAEWGPAAVEERARFVHPIGSPVRLLRVAIAVRDPQASAAVLGGALGVPVQAVTDLGVVQVGVHELRLVPRRDMAAPAAITLSADVETPTAAALLGLHVGVERASNEVAVAPPG
jgi:hypothetical protein